MSSDEETTPKAPRRGTRDRKVVKPFLSRAYSYYAYWIYILTSVQSLNLLGSESDRELRTTAAMRREQTVGGQRTKSQRNLWTTNSRSLRRNHRKRVSRATRRKRRNTKPREHHRPRPCQPPKEEERGRHRQLPSRPRRNLRLRSRERPRPEARGIMEHR